MLRKIGSANGPKDVNGEAAAGEVSSIWARCFDQARAVELHFVQADKQGCRCIWAHEAREVSSGAEDLATFGLHRLVSLETE
jgi:hypothetical protein